MGARQVPAQRAGFEVILSSRGQARGHCGTYKLYDEICNTSIIRLVPAYDDIITRSTQQAYVL